MGKYIICLLLLFVSSSLSAQNVVFDKAIEEFDVCDQAKNAENRSQYWKMVVEHNIRLKKFRKARERNSRMYRKTFKVIRRDSLIIDFNSRFLPIIKDLNFLGDSLAAQLSVDGDVTKVKIRILNSKELNAFAQPNGNIYVYAGLLKNDDLTYYGLLGILAHETAHAVLKHGHVQIYNDYKHRFKANLAGGIIVALQTTTVAINPYTTDDDIDRLGRNARDIQQRIDEGQKIFHYSYSRDQEIEADIIAYRFLEFLERGLGNEYIKALEILDDGNPYTFEFSEHPSTQFRINLLRYIRQREGNY